MHHISILNVFKQLKADLIGKILTGLLLIMACNHSPNECFTEYTIDIRDYNESLAFTRYYHIHNDTIKIAFLDNILKNKNRILCLRILNKKEHFKLCNYISNLKIDSLQSKYIDSSVADGNEKDIDISIGSKKKSIYVANYYHQTIADLISSINEIIDSSNLKLKYRKYDRVSNIPLKFKPKE